MKSFSLTAFALASLIFVSDAKRPKHDHCGTFPVSYQVLSGNSPAKDVVLHRRCPYGPTGHYSDIDFDIPSQNLTVYYGSKGEQFFQGYHFGDEFLMTNRSDDPGTNITLFSEIVNMSQEQYAKYQLAPVRIISDQQERFKTGNMDTFVWAYLHIDRAERWNGHFVQLSPGWIGKLESPTDMLTQTMITEKDSNLTKQQVTVMRGWLNTTRFPGVYATVRRSIMKAFEPITIFTQKPTLESLIPDHMDIDITSSMFPTNTHFHKPGKLRPGWLGSLDQPTKQMMYYDEKTMEVAVWPGTHRIEEGRGYMASYNDGYAIANITIYLNSEPEMIPENRIGMNMIVDIVKQAGQTLKDSKIALSPGWYGMLKTGSRQYVKPLNTLGSVSPSDQKATVKPGWRVFEGDNGFNALYRYDGELRPISVEFD